MAEVEKHTTDAMIMIMKHNERELKNDSNKDIIQERSHLNYSIPLDHGGLTDRAYFKKIVNDSYLYGRGSSREADAVTSFSWVITLPKEISDYTAIDKTVTGYLNPKEERQFFDGAVRFVSDRYGAENVVHNKIHYDEAGQPHIHIYVVPRKELDHGLVHYKTQKTKEAIQTNTGRWEYKYRYKLDEKGEKIPIKNYAKMSDYYDKKLACKEIINSAELKHFHPDFAEFLRKNNLPGADAVHTGVTGGKNISVKSMKEFTKTTGMTIDQIKDLSREKETLQSRVTELDKDVKELNSTIYEKNSAIKDLKQQLFDMKLSLNRSAEMSATKNVLEAQLSVKERELSQLNNKLASKEAELTAAGKNYEELQTRYEEAEKTISAYKEELNRTRAMVKELQQDRTLTTAKDREIEALQHQISSLKDQLKDVQHERDAAIAAKDKEIEQLKAKEASKEQTREWGTSAGWGQSKGWGSERSEKTWEQESTWDK